MYHIFSIHLSIEGHLGCFQVLAITNNAAMNMVEQICKYFCGVIEHPLGICLIVVLLGLEVDQLLSF